MESYKIEHLTFTYPTMQFPSLNDVNLMIKKGEFITLCGKSGCGKSTLLRHLKPLLTPVGEKSGAVLFEGKELCALSEREQAEKIGFVLQSPENQLVTDKVWHELAFGLESLGIETNEIRARVAEMASFFGIQEWFHKSVSELSGGQKQILNLASVMLMQPSVLILDEPTSQLDPISAHDFLDTVFKINRELGTTVILSEHRLEDALPMSDRVIVMENGEIEACGEPRKVGEMLQLSKSDMFVAFPALMQIYAGVKNSLECPLTVREGRAWLEKMAERITPSEIPEENYTHSETEVIKVDDVWFRYEKNLPDTLRGLSLKVYKGELLSIVGGNGAGKTTALSVMTGLLRPYRGKVSVCGTRLTGISDKFSGMIGVLPQNPQNLFVKKTVELDLYEMLKESSLTKEEKRERVDFASQICEINSLLDRHPYDLSGGEQQRAALAKVLLLKPKILFLDEPTKGLDAHFKQRLAKLFEKLKKSGVTIVMVSHDIEFCARYADRCAMFFDGNIVSVASPREFFAGKSFYTTAAGRMSKTILPKAILTEDVILALGGQPSEKTDDKKDSKPNNNEKVKTQKNQLAYENENEHRYKPLKESKNEHNDKPTTETNMSEHQFAVKKNNKQSNIHCVKAPSKQFLSKGMIAALAMIFLAVPLTIYIGLYIFEDKKYYITSLLIAFETLIPFAILFEGRKPKARELILISVLCAIAVCGRAAFFMLQQFKPVLALVIISGVCLGGETGFLVGSITAFASNMLFGQGPYTPWQMLALGIIGFLAGVLFRKDFLKKTRGSLCIFGFLAAMLIYGGIMNPASVLILQPKPTAALFASAYLLGLPFDLIHAAATVFFLFFLSMPMLEKLDRIKTKYGLI